MKYVGILLFFLWSVTLAAQVLLDSKVILEEQGKKNAYPRLSKDGRQILYQTNRSGKWQLEIMDLASKKSNRVLADGFNNNFPDWSPDNQWIAFVSDRDGNEEIYMARINGTGLKRLTNNKARDIHPYFSPDGKSLLFNSDRGNGSLDVYRIMLTSGELERLTDTPQNETCARYSPDMKQMLLLRNDESTDDIFLYDFKTKQFTNLTNTPASTDGWPMYSRDGKWIFFSSMETGRYCLHRIRPDGSAREKLSEPRPGEEDARVCISYDGRTIVFNKETAATIAIYSAILKNVKP